MDSSSESEDSFVSDIKLPLQLASGEQLEASKNIKESDCYLELTLDDQDCSGIIVTLKEEQKGFHIFPKQIVKELPDLVANLRTLLDSGWFCAVVIPGKHLLKGTDMKIPSGVLTDVCLFSHAEPVLVLTCVRPGTTCDIQRYYNSILSSEIEAHVVNKLGGNFSVAHGVVEYDWTSDSFANTIKNLQLAAQMTSFSHSLLMSSERCLDVARSIVYIVSNGPDITFKGADPNTVASRGYTERTMLPRTVGNAPFDCLTTLPSDTSQQNCLATLEDRAVATLHDVEKSKLVVCKKLRRSADYLDKQQRYMNIAKTTFASSGIASSVLAVVGLGLAPITFGASLGLTIAGMALGISSGVGAVTTEVADKIVNSRALKDAQNQIDNHNKQVTEFLQLMDTIKERETPDNFSSFLKSRIGKINSRFYEFISINLTKRESSGYSPELPKAGVRVRAAAGRIATEVLEASSKAIKVGSLVCTVLTIPLDLHTIVTNSIKIHKRTPSETAEYIRQLADDLELGDSGGAMEDSKLKIEIFERELKRQKEKMYREWRQRLSQWQKTMRAISGEVCSKLHNLACQHAYLRRRAVNIQLSGIVIHVLARICLLYPLPLLLTSDPTYWIHTAALCSLAYDGYYLVLSIGIGVLTHYTIGLCKNEVCKGISNARNIFKTAPSDILKSAQDRISSFQSNAKVELKETSRYYNVFEIMLVVCKTVINIAILNSFYNIGDWNDPTEHSGTFRSISSWFVIFLKGESVGRPDLLIVWIFICTFLISSLCETRRQEVYHLSRDIGRLADDFKVKVADLMGEYDTSSK